MVTGKAFSSCELSSHLCTEVEVAEEDGCLGAGNDQNDEDEKEKSVPGKLKH